MPKDPTHVRLGNSHVHGMLADITERHSLWNISGLEVKPFPSDIDPDAQAFVRDKIRMGLIEPAEPDEYEDQQRAADSIRASHLQSLGDRLGSDIANVQEAPIQDIVRQTQHRILTRRVDGTVPPLDDEEDLSSLEGLSNRERRDLTNLSESERAELRELQSVSS